MTLIGKIKRDFTRHRHKAAVLAVLFTVMVVMSVRAALELRPQAAVASVDIPTLNIPVAAKPTGTEGAEAEARIRESKELWKQLQEKRGVDVAVAFSFESNLYPLDPSRRMVAAPLPENPDPTPATQVVDDGEIVRRAAAVAAARVRDQSQDLHVKSTTVSGAGKPWAIVNQQLVSIGDQIKGFEITAIRAREVEFKKEGVTIAVKMPDDLRGQ